MTFLSADYQKAFAGLNVKAVYMEVDVAPEDHIKEADGLVAQRRAGNTPTIAATIVSSRPACEQRKLWSGNATRFYGFWATMSWFASFVTCPAPLGAKMGGVLTRRPGRWAKRARSPLWSLRS
jgi:predicted TIM-barrel fold metal-dependent hydrolase